jgi:glutaredoxin
MKLLLATSKFCGPCHVIKRKLADENITVDTIDLEEDTDAFKKHGIRGVPTLLVLQDDECIEKIQGNNDIINKIKENA